VVVGLGELVELALEVHVFVRQIELANPRIDVGLDVRYAGNIGQIASDRSGTARSRHARQVEDHEPCIGGGRILRRTRGRSDRLRSAAADQRDSSQSPEEQTAIHQDDLHKGW
jgi:hypothetical protein